MRALSMIPLMAGLAACVPMSDSNETMLTGTVTYRERIALPPDSRLIVEISDVSLMDAPSVTIAQNQISTAGQQVPISFTVSYDRARIQPGRRYSVSARILDGRLDGSLLERLAAGDADVLQELRHRFEFLRQFADQPDRRCFRGVRPGQ